MNATTKKSCQTRLRRIEGQVRGIGQMIEGDRYCIDVLTQLLAVKAALKQVEDEILKDHISHCVANAILSGTDEARNEKIDELLDMLARSR
ncbi:metal-sensitive transcriptional regulator [Emcibacter sp. SYSU 3D8]|uniref:metal-sensitive transcriptional regulator n=1 Tax=Emcibacter sp. SYSU 3D8 TaxID=3133969 RepID=UPI0031FEB23C